MSRAARSPARRVGRAVTAALTITAIALLAAFGWAALRGRSADLPWTPLDLGEEPVKCRALLDRAGVRYVSLPVREESQACVSRDAVRLEPGGSRRLPLAPDSPRLACPMAAAVAMWEWSVVQRAAATHLRTQVVEVEHLGSYSCRRMYGRDAGPWSEHATADALDIAGFRLADGRRVTVVGDWRGSGGEARFLRAVRDGACRLFATVLSPDYNAAHRDHFHLDQARRGALGHRACR